MEFYEMLIMLRKKNGISQEEFGQTIGVSRQAVSKWESGESMPDIEKLKRISNYYGLTIDDLLNGKVDGKRFDHLEWVKYIEPDHCVLLV